MKLQPVRDNPLAAPILYKLLKERPQAHWISHDGETNYHEHLEFVKSHPFHHWYLIEVDDFPVGSLEVTRLNEIGVHILTAFQRRGYATQAVQLLMATHRPLEPIAAVRNGRWLANVSPGNEASRSFWRKLGFNPIQETYAL